MRKLVLTALFFSFGLAAALFAEGEYRVGPGDVLSVDVFDEPRFSGRYEVSRAGSIDYPYLGEVPVTGLSEDGIDLKLSELLARDYIVHPRVAVRIVEYGSQKVIIVGAVSKPGTYPLMKKRDLISVLNQAGGIANQASAQILLIRQLAPGTEPASPPGQGAGTPSAAGPLSGEAASGQPAEAGDVEPGAQPSVDGSTMAAASRNVHPVEPMLIDIGRLFSKGDLTQNVELRDGDIVNVQEPNEVYVYGSVNKPGSVPYRKGMNVREAVSLAGGANDAASSKGAYVLRGRGQGKEQRLPARLDQAIKGKGTPLALEPNDFIMVPESFF